MKIEVLISVGPRHVLATVVHTEQAPTVAEVQATAFAQLDVAPLAQAVWAYAVWGKRTELTATLHDGDRLELCRPLTVDPKEARRLRFNQQGSRAAGLFAKRRQGAKAGY